MSKNYKPKNNIKKVSEEIRNKLELNDVKDK